MNLDPLYLLFALIGSAIGTGAFMYGKKVQKGKPMVIGVVLLVLSYFVTTPIWLGLTTLGLTVLLVTDTTQLIYRLTDSRKNRDIQSIE